MKNRKGISQIWEIVIGAAIILLILSPFIADALHIPSLSDFFRRLIFGKLISGIK